MIGAGGAARAIGVELALAGAAHIIVVNRDPTRGEELAQLLNREVRRQAQGDFTADFTTWQESYSVPAGTNVVINATSVGPYPDIDARLNLNLDSLTDLMVVADVIPNPPRTNLINDAEARGCRVIDGLGMLVNQGVTGIEYWTGIRPDATVMRAKLDESFGNAISV